MRLAISAGILPLFEVIDISDKEAMVKTPMTRADGSKIELTVMANGAGFRLSAPVEIVRNDSILTLSRLRSDQVKRVCDGMGVSLDDVSLTCPANDAIHLGEAMVKLSQSVVCLTYLANARL